MSTEPQVKSYDDVFVCDCAPSTAVAYPSAINPKTTQLVGIVINTQAAGLSTLPKGAQVSYGLIVGPSDTIPGPPGPGQLQSLFARTRGGAFSTALQGMYAAGLVAPSDTIPAPPAPGGGALQVLSNGNLLGWLSVEALAKQNLLTSNLQGVVVKVTKGNKVLYDSGVIAVGIISPERGD